MTYVKSRSTVDFPQQIMNLLIVVIGNIYPRFALRHEYIPSLYGKATNIEDIHTILNRRDSDSRWSSYILSTNPGPEVIKLFSCSTQLSMKF